MSYMIWFILPFIAISKVEYPKFSILGVGRDTSQNEMERYKDYLKNNKNQICKEYQEESSDDFDFDLCLAQIDAVEQTKYSSGPNINKVLSQFSKKNEFLFINGNPYTEINFNKLKTQMVVLYYCNEEETLSDQKQNPVKFIMDHIIRSSFDGTKNGIPKLTKSMKPKYSRSFANLKIVGNIKKKVSYLTVSSCIVTFTQNDLDINSFFLCNGIIANESKSIKTNYFIFDYESYELNKDKLKNQYIKVNQISYGANLEYNSDSRNVFRIVYSNNCFLLQNVDHELIMSIPYDIESVFNIIASANEYYIEIEDGANVDVFNGINITVGKQLLVESPFGKMLEKKQIIIHSDGFKDIDESKRPKVSLQYDSSNYDFTPSQDSPITITKEKLYSYKPQHKKKLSGGAIAGIVIACVVVVAIIIIVVVVVIKKKRDN